MQKTHTKWATRNLINWRHDSTSGFRFGKEELIGYLRRCEQDLESRLFVPPITVRIASAINETQGENKFISWYIIIPAGLAAACILWCKWGKYRVFKLSAPETSTGETPITKGCETSAKPSQSPQITEPSKPKSQLFEME